MKKYGKRTIALLLSTVMVLSAFITTSMLTVSAAFF